MEFKLNKIDTDIRKKMQEEIKEDKVHTAKGVTVKKDFKNEKKENINQDNDKKENKKRYIIIDGVKHNEIKIEMEKVVNMNDENSKGRILDKKK